jgi:CRP/FNR family transcriptional regulator, nitrogen oxide reductase regulator
MDDESAPATSRSGGTAEKSVPQSGRQALSLLQTSAFLREVPATLVAELAAGATVRELSVAEHLWREGDDAQSFHVIGRGLITVRRHLASGSEVIVAIFGPGESVGDTAVLEHAPYPADAVVASDHAVVIAIPARRLLELSTRQPAIASALQQALLRHSAALRTKVEILSAGTVKARLANLFLHLAARFGDEPRKGAIVVPLPLSRAALAGLVSARVETVIRALRPWELSGVVRTIDGGFVIGSVATLQACCDLG